MMVNNSILMEYDEDDKDDNKDEEKTNYKWKQLVIFDWIHSWGSFNVLMTINKKGLRDEIRLSNWSYNYHN